MVAAKQEVIRINCNLEGEAARHFRFIKQKKGLKQKTDVVRLAVNELYTALVREA